jgi:hypothetical protein
MAGEGLHRGVCPAGHRRSPMLFTRAGWGHLGIQVAEGLKGMTEAHTAHAIPCLEKLETSRADSEDSPWPADYHCVTYT